MIASEIDGDCAVSQIYDPSLLLVHFIKPKGFETPLPQLTGVRCSFSLIQAASPFFFKAQQAIPDSIEGWSIKTSQEQ